MSTLSHPASSGTARTRQYPDHELTSKCAHNDGCRLPLNDHSSHQNHAGESASQGSSSWLMEVQFGGHRHPRPSRSPIGFQETHGAIVRLAFRTRHGCLENQPSTICNWRARVTALRQLILCAHTLASTNRFTLSPHAVHSAQKNVVAGRCRWCSWNPGPSRLRMLDFGQFDFGFGQLAEIELAEAEVEQMVFALFLLFFLVFSFCFCLSFAFFCFFFVFFLILLFLFFLFSFYVCPKNMNPEPRTPNPEPSAGQPSAGQPSGGQPSAGQPSAGPWASHDNPRTPNVHISGKHHQREGEKNDNCGGRGKKKREILGPPPFGAPPFGAPLFVVPKFNIQKFNIQKLAEVEIGRSRNWLKSKLAKVKIGRS